MYLLAENVAGARDVINPGGGKLGSERAGRGGAITEDGDGRLSGSTAGAGNIPAYNDRITAKSIPSAAADAADDDDDDDDDDGSVTA